MHRGSEAMKNKRPCRSPNPCSCFRGTDLLSWSGSLNLSLPPPAATHLQEELWLVGSACMLPPGYDPKRSQIIAHGLIYGHLNDFPSQSYRPALEILWGFSAPLPEKSKSLVYPYVTLSARVGPSWLLLGVNSTSLSFPLQTGHMYRRGGSFLFHMVSSPPWARDPGRAPGRQLGTEGKQQQPLL